LNKDELDFINSASARTKYVQNLKIDDLMESNVNTNSVIGGVNGKKEDNNKLIGSLAKNNNDFLGLELPKPKKKSKKDKKKKDKEPKGKKDKKSKKKA